MYSASWFEAQNTCDTAEPILQQVKLAIKERKLNFTTDYLSKLPSYIHTNISMTISTSQVEAIDQLLNEFYSYHNNIYIWERIQFTIMDELNTI